MKTLLIAIAILASVGFASAGQRIDAAAWKNVQTYDVATVLEKAPSLIGQVVGVRFHYRSPKLRHLLPGWYQAALWQHDPKAKKGYSAFRVMIAKKDVPAFESITSDFNAMTDIVVYGRIEKDPEINEVHLRVFGRKAAVDGARNALIDW
ncbi:MAG TPA: hypothetical protein VM940_08445 [Chthoniobacterales bacterium]|jgi:hypothetical protein|nr:hypothetical protein [Chthoniobacterales bacterium]